MNIKINNHELNTIDIIAVDGSNKELERAFISVALKMDRTCPQKIPRFREVEEALLNTDTNFFFHRGHSRYWLAKRGGQYIGRIAAIIDEKIPVDSTNPKTGFIGLYEAESDSVLAYLLISTATRYLESQGCETVTGPIDFSIYHQYRYQSDHFDSKCFIGEPRNPKYYLDHFTNNGFTCSHTWQSHMLSSEAITKSMARLKIDYQQSLELGYQFITFANYSDEAATHLLWTLIQKTYRGMPGFFELSFADFQQQYATLWHIIDTDASLFLLDDNNTPIGFSVVFQDKVAAISAMQGRTNFWSKLKFKLNENKGDVANAYQTGIVYSAIKRAAIRGIRKNNRRLSIAKAIYYQGAVQIRNNPKYKSVIISLLRSDTPNIHVTKKFATQTRHYQLLSRQLEPNPINH